jgi:hypothetical protein
MELQAQVVSTRCVAKRASRYIAPHDPAITLMFTFVFIQALSDRGWWRILVICAGKRLPRIAQALSRVPGTDGAEQIIYIVGIVFMLVIIAATLYRIPKAMPDNGVMIGAQWRSRIRIDRAFLLRSSCRKN